MDTETLIVAGVDLTSDRVFERVRHRRGAAVTYEAACVAYARRDDFFGCYVVHGVPASAIPPEYVDVEMDGGAVTFVVCGDGAGQGGGVVELTAEEVEWMAAPDALSDEQEAWLAELRSMAAVAQSDGYRRALDSLAAAADAPGVDPETRACVEARLEGFGLCCPVTRDWVKTPVTAVLEDGQTHTACLDTLARDAAEGRRLLPAVQVRIAEVRAKPKTDLAMYARALEEAATELGRRTATGPRPTGAAVGGKRALSAVVADDAETSGISESKRRYIVL